MGNYPACLSTEHFHQMSSSRKHRRDHDHGDALSPKLAEDFSCSTLPLLLSESTLHSSPPPQYPATQPPEAVTAPPTQLPDRRSSHLKPVTKKVRFAEEVMLIASTSTPHPINIQAEKYVASFISSHATKEAAESEVEVLHKTENRKPFMDQSSSGGHTDERSISTCMDQSSREITERSSDTKAIRLKVVISKKELSQLLMSPKSSTSSSPAMELGASSDVLMGRILTPLLCSHRNSFSKSQSLINSCQKFGIPCTWTSPLQQLAPTRSEDVKPIELTA